jgi:hypothetical protein
MQQQETIHAVMAPLDDDSIRLRIMTIRGVQVMFDRDLADIYGVTTKRLNEQVKRNIDRFPPTFRFALSVDEMSELVANCDRFRTMKHSSVPMSAFTEHGIIMLASVLKSDVAIQASIRITTAFVAMRKALASIAPIIARVETVERRQITDQQRNEERQALRRIFICEEAGPQGEEEHRPRGQLLRRCHARHPFAKMRRCGCADCHHAQVGHQVHFADRRRQVQQAESDAHDQDRWFIPR